MSMKHNHSWGWNRTKQYKIWILDFQMNFGEFGEIWFDDFVNSELFLTKLSGIDLPEN